MKNKTPKQPILASILYWMVAASFGLSLVIWSQFISPFHFGKVVLFRWLVEVMVVLWAVLLLKYPSYRPRWTLLTKLATLFTIVFVVTTFTATDVLRAWWGTYERMGGLFSFLHYLAWLWIVVTVVRSGRQWENLLKLSIITGIISALYGFAQEFEIWRGFIQGEELSNSVGTIGNAALFSGFLIVNLFFAAYLAVRERTTLLWRIIALVGIGVMGLNIFNAGVRGSVAASAIGLVIFALMLPRRTRFERRIKIPLVVILLGMVAFGLFAVSVPNPVVEKLFPQDLQSFGLGTRTVQTRLWAWGASWQGFIDKPILGWGPSNYAFAFNAHFNPLHYTGLGSETWFDRAHNVFLDVLVAHGIVGFAVFAALLGVLLQRIWRLRKSAPVLSAALFGGTIAYLIHDAWILDTFVNYLLFVFIIGFVDWFDRLKAREKDEEGGGSKKKKKITAVAARRLSLRDKGIIGVLAAGMLTLIWWGGIRPIDVNWNTTRAMIAGTRDANKALDHWELALDGSYSGQPESIFQLLLYAIRIEENDHLPIGRLDQTDLRRGAPVPKNIRLATLRFAVSRAEKFLEKHPREAQLHIILGRAQNMIGSQYVPSFMKKAEETMRRGIALSPTRPRFHYELGQSLMNQGRLLEALEVYTEARDINPDVGVSWWYLALVKSRLGRSLEALEDIQKSEELGFDPERNLFQMRQLVDVYVALGNYQEAARLLEKAIQLSPQTASFWSALAETYRRLGEFDLAQSAAERLLELDPSRAATIESFLSDLASESAP